MLRTVAARVVAGRIQPIEGLLAIFNMNNMVGEIAAAQGTKGHLGIPWIVLHQEDLDFNGVVHGANSRIAGA